MEAGLTRPILVVEDDDYDASEIQTSIANFGARSDRVRTAAGALDYLQGDAEGGTRQRPRLVLLDWVIPDGGAMVLRAMRKDPALEDIPVVVFSWSMIDSDAKTAYRLGANAFVEKVADVRGWEKTITTICEFWLNVAKVT